MIAYNQSGEPYQINQRQNPNPQAEQKFQQQKQYQNIILKQATPKTPLNYNNKNLQATPSTQQGSPSPDRKINIQFKVDVNSKTGKITTYMEPIYQNFKLNQLQNISASSSAAVKKLNEKNGQMEQNIGTKSVKTLIYNNGQIKKNLENTTYNQLNFIDGEQNQNPSVMEVITFNSNDDELIKNFDTAVDTFNCNDEELDQNFKKQNYNEGYQNQNIDNKKFDTQNYNDNSQLNRNIGIDKVNQLNYNDELLYQNLRSTTVNTLNYNNEKQNQNFGSSAVNTLNKSKNQLNKNVRNTAESIKNYNNDKLNQNFEATPNPLIQNNNISNKNISNTPVNTLNHNVNTLNYNENYLQRNFSNPEEGVVNYNEGQLHQNLDPAMADPLNNNDNVFNRNISTTSIKTQNYNDGQLNQNLDNKKVETLNYNDKKQNQNLGALTNISNYNDGQFDQNVGTAVVNILNVNNNNLLGNIGITQDNTLNYNDDQTVKKFQNIQYSEDSPGLKIPPPSLNLSKQQSTQQNKMKNQQNQYPNKAAILSQFSKENSNKQQQFTQEQIQKNQYIQYQFKIPTSQQEKQQNRQKTQENDSGYLNYDLFMEQLYKLDNIGGSKQVSFKEKNLNTPLQTYNNMQPTTVNTIGNNFEDNFLPVFLEQQQKLSNIQAGLQKNQKLDKMYKKAVINSIQVFKKNEKINLKPLERSQNQKNVDIDISPYNFELLSIKHDIEEARKSILNQQNNLNQKIHLTTKFLTPTRHQRKRSLSSSFQTEEGLEHFASKNFINSITELMFGVNPFDILKREQVNENLPDGSVYKGEKYLNLPNGIGKRIYPNGEYYIGEWRRGQKEGFGTYYLANDKILYQGEWKNDDYDGIGILFNADVEEVRKKINCENFNNVNKKWLQFSGEFFGGKYNGIGFLLFSNKSTFYGNFLGGAAHGLGVYENKGEIVSGIWQQNYLYKYL